MFRAMVWKELREVAGIALVILLAYGLLLVIVEYPKRVPFAYIFLTGLNRSPNQDPVPFVYDGFVGGYAFLAALGAIALGLRQTLGESVRGTYSLLFHRRASRDWLLGMKLFVGLAVYLICGAIPILAYGHWTATPGHRASPFEWSMTVSTWIIWFDMTVLYGGAFLSGIRTGRWIGTRLLPLVATVVVLITLVVNLGGAPFVWTGYLVTVAINILIIIAILFVARSRDYS